MIAAARTGSNLKRRLALAAAALFALGAGACGSGGDALLVGDEDRDSAHPGYYDGDDGEVRSDGHAAGTADTHALTTLVQRYYAAVAAGDAKTACALTYYIEAETIPEQYGRPPGPRWLSGAKTCPAVLSLVFEHFHRQLLAPVTVTGTRVSGSRADVLVGFRTLPAGFLKARREGGAWKVDGLLAAPLP